MTDAYLRRAWADVNLDAIEQNAAWLVKSVAPACLCAVVKADAYGHGAVVSAKAALRGGATWLAVAVVEEGVELREAAIDAPILVLSEPPPAALEIAYDYGLTVTAFSEAFIDGLSASSWAAKKIVDKKLSVHMKVDTGMHRIGVDPENAAKRAERICASDYLDLGGVWTHLSVADDPTDPFTDQQLNIFSEVLDGIRNVGIDPGLHHAANSAASTRPDARLDMVRCGIALYGYAPSAQLRANMAGLSQAMQVRAEVSHVAKYGAGTRVSYGRRRALPIPSTVATLPLGYADGLPWRLFGTQAQVLIGGKRLPLAGAVTMDQVLVDCGSSEVEVGQEAVLIGGQGSEAISAQDWASWLGTIVWEVLGRMGSRLHRRYSGGPAGGPVKACTSGKLALDTVPSGVGQASPDMQASPDA